MWIWYNPVKVVFGKGSLKSLKELLPEGRVLLVTGRKFVRGSGLINQLEEILKGREWKWFDGVTPEPTWEVAQRLVDVVREKRPDVVLAVGGGSVLDVAKLAAAMRDNPGSVRELIGVKEPFKKKGAKIVAVPTTSGSGSEVTPYCVIMDKEHFKKAPVTSSFCFPDVAIDDPELTYSAPREIARNAGVDALSHCLEAYLSKKASPLVKCIAAEGIKIVFRHLKNAVEGNRRARDSMMLASLYGGLAISCAGAGLVHQMGHALTFLRGYPHGLTMGIYMVPVLEFYGDAIRREISELEEHLGIKHFTGFLYRFLEELGIPKLEELNLTEEEQERTADFVLSRKSIVEVLPVKVSREDIIGIMRGDYV